MLIDLVSNEGVSGAEILADLQSIKDMTAEMERYVDEAINRSYKDIDEVLKEKE